MTAKARRLLSALGLCALAFSLKGPAAWGSGGMITAGALAPRAVQSGLFAPPMQAWGPVLRPFLNSAPNLDSFLDGIGMKRPSTSVFFEDLAFRDLPAREQRKMEQALAYALQAAGVSPEQFLGLERAKIGETVEKGQDALAQDLDAEDDPAVLSAKIEAMETVMEASARYFPSRSLARAQASYLSSRARLLAAGSSAIQDGVEATVPALGLIPAQAAGALIPAREGRRGTLQARARTGEPEQEPAFALELLPAGLDNGREGRIYAARARLHNWRNNVAAGWRGVYGTGWRMYRTLARALVERGTVTLLPLFSGTQTPIFSAVDYLAEIGDQESIPRLLELLARYTPRAQVQDGRTWFFQADDGSAYYVSSYGPQDYLPKDLQGSIIKALTRLLPAERAERFVSVFLTIPIHSLSRPAVDALLDFALRRKMTELVPLLLARAQATRERFDREHHEHLYGHGGHLSYANLYAYENLAYAAYRLAAEGSPEKASALALLIAEYNHPQGQGPWASTQRSHDGISTILSQIIDYDLARNIPEKARVIAQLDPEQFAHDMAYYQQIKKIAKKEKLIDPEPPAPAPKLGWGRRLLDWWLSTQLMPFLYIRIPTTSPRLSLAQKAEVKALIRPGDVLLESNDEWVLWQIFHWIVTGSGDWIHVAMYAGDGTVIETGNKNPHRVGSLSLDEFMETHHVAVLRPRYQTPEDLEAALEYVRDAFRRRAPYDKKLNMSDLTAYYCGKLVYYALLGMPNPIRVPLHRTMGRMGLPPYAFLESPDIDTVWTNGSDFWKSLASHWP